MIRRVALKPPELAVWLWAESALLTVYTLAQLALPPALSNVIAHDPCTHLAGVVFLALGYADLRLARSRATGGRRLAVRACAVVLLLLGGGFALGDRMLWALDALRPGASVRAWCVGGASVVIGLCGLWLWRTSPLRRR